MKINEQSPKYLEALHSLPEELQAYYQTLVRQYAFHTTRFYGKGYVAYKVLAALIQDGWRLEAGASGRAHE